MSNKTWRVHVEARLLASSSARNVVISLPISRAARLRSSSTLVRIASQIATSFLDLTDNLFRRGNDLQVFERLQEAVRVKKMNMLPERHVLDRILFKQNEDLILGGNCRPQSIREFPNSQLAWGF